MTSGPDPLAVAEAAGRRAYEQGRPAAPAADPSVLELVAGMPFPGGGAIAVFAAFTRGRDAAADEAAEAALRQ